MIVDPPGDDAGDREHAADGVVYVVFGEHHVRVRADSPEVCAALQQTFGSMAKPSPDGIPAGTVQALESSGSYRVVGTGASQSAGTAEWAVRELYHATVKSFMVARQDLVWVHAGVMGHADRAHLFSGASGQGKSTMVAEFLERGWSYYSDEVAAIDVSRALVHPFPIAPRRRIQQAQFRWLEDVEQVRSLPKVEVELAQRTIAAHAMPVACIWFLRYDPSAADVSSEPCSPADAVMEMLRNSLSITPDRTREIAGLARLAAAVPARRLAYPDPAAAVAHVHASVTGSASS